MSETEAAAATPIIAKAMELAGPRKQLLTYFLIGASASAIDVLLFLVLYNVVHTTPLVAHSVAVPSAVLFSFITNARHNFRVSDHMVLRLISFVVVCGIGYAVGFMVIEFVRSMGLGANLGKILSLPVVFVLQYFLNSRITFWARRAAAAGETEAAP